LIGHTESVESVSFSPDGMILASGSWDKTIKLWNTSDGTELYSLSEHIESVNSVVFSPDGTILASGSFDNTTKLWNVAKKTEVEVVTLSDHNDPVASVAFSVDGAILASGSWDNKIKIWNVTNGLEMHTLTGHTDWVESVSFSPDGKMLASGSYDNTIKLWNVSDWTEFRTLSGHSFAVESITFSPWSTILASGSLDGTIKLWNVTTGIELGTLIHNQDSEEAGVFSVVFSPDGKILASAGWGLSMGSPISTIKLWNVTTREEIEILLGGMDGFNTLVFSPSGTILGGCCGNSIKLWNVTTRNEITTLIAGPVEYYSVFSVDFSPNGKLLASGDDDNYIMLWNVSDWTELQVLPGHTYPISSVAFSPDGTILASGSLDETIKLWNVASISKDIDFDFDGIADLWERQYGLNPANFWDKFDDQDEDGLINSLEFFLKTNPENIDSDGDWMPDPWEYVYRLDPTSNDAALDKDGDNINNLYEFRCGLNPLVDDAELDKDGDGLSNLQEFYFGSWAHLNDSENDGMPDLYEFQMGLDPKVNDAAEDKDNDGMPNLWEYQNGFNATDSTDALKDSDGDWVANVVEFRGGSDPHDFWSVPLFSFSIIHFGVLLIILISAVSSVMLMNYRKKQKEALIVLLKAPDYATALKLKKLGFTDHISYTEAKTELKTLIQMGNNSYSEGEFLTAIQHYEHALKLANRLQNDLLIAEIVFRIARVHQEKRILTHESSILLNFPTTPYKHAMIEAYDHMIKALLAETEKNWGLADKAWNDALNIEGLDIEFYTICQGAIVNSEVKNWLDNPTSAAQEEVLVRLEQWQKTCETNEYFQNLCEVYLLRARMALSNFQFDEVEKWLELCLKTAEESGLAYHHKNAMREKTIFAEHKQRILSLLEKETLLPEEQQKKLEEYIKAALLSLET
jgi:WD40 repeat protein